MGLQNRQRERYFHHQNNEQRERSHRLHGYLQGTGFQDLPLWKLLSQDLRYQRIRSLQGSLSLNGISQPDNQHEHLELLRFPH